MAVEDVLRILIRINVSGDLRKSRWWTSFPGQSVILSPGVRRRDGWYSDQEERAGSAWDALLERENE